MNNPAETRTPDLSYLLSYARPADPSHTFDPESDRCWYCDCRPGGMWAPLPCEGR